MAGAGGQTQMVKDLQRHDTTCLETPAAPGSSGSDRKNQEGAWFISG